MALRSGRMTLKNERVMRCEMLIFKRFRSQVWMFTVEVDILRVADETILNHALGETKSVCVALVCALCVGKDKMIAKSSDDDDDNEVIFDNFFFPKIYQ